MYKHLQYQTPENDMVLATRQDGTMLVVEPDSPEWMPVVSYKPEAYQAPSQEYLLSTERASMRCRAAAMRLVLVRAGKLGEVQALADSDPEASIVWEYEPEYVRNSPFIESLGVGALTPEEIDDLFREAMKL